MAPKINIKKFVDNTANIIAEKIHNTKPQTELIEIFTEKNLDDAYGEFIIFDEFTDTRTGITKKLKKYKIGDQTFFDVHFKYESGSLGFEISKRVEKKLNKKFNKYGIRIKLMYWDDDASVYGHCNTELRPTIELIPIKSKCVIL